MKKALLILGLICFMAPIALAEEPYYGENRDVLNRNSFEVDENILREINAAARNKNYSDDSSQRGSSESKGSGKTTTTKGKRQIKFDNTGSSPSNTQYHYGRPNYGTRGKYGGGS